MTELSRSQPSDRITWKLLWRVTQGQYDPFSLLCVYMVNWKLLMRKVTMKEKPGSRESILDKEEDNEFRAFLKDKGELRITYREVQFKETTLMVFRNRSGEACCLLFI